MSLRWLAPVDRLQAGDALVVPDIARGEKHPLLQRRGRDKDIGVADQLAALLEVGVDGGRSNGDGVCHGQDVAVLAQGVESQLLAYSAFGSQSSQNLVVGEHRDSEALILAQVGLSSLYYVLVALLQNLRKGVRVEQCTHCVYSRPLKKWLRSRAIRSTSSTSSGERPS